MFESSSECGITHFLEHALIRNVSAVMGGKLYSELDRLGLEFNASTYAEMVQFYISGASAHIREAADIFTKLFEKIVLTKDEIDAERGRIKAEIRESGDKTSLATFSAGKVHENTTLAASITGTAGSVSKIGVTRLEEYRKRVFTSENIFFYMTGNFSDTDAEYLLSLADKYSLSHSAHRRNLAPLPKSFGKRDSIIHIKNADFTAVRFTFDIDMSEMTVAESDVLYDTLISGYNSRLFMELSERRGLVYDISGALERYENIGTLYFTYELRPDKLLEAVRATVEVLSALKGETLSRGECMLAGYVDNAYVLYDDFRELNFTFAYDNHILGAKYPDIDARASAYSAVTPERISELCRLVFQRKNLTFTMKGDKKRIDSAELTRILAELGGNAPIPNANS